MTKEVVKWNALWIPTWRLYPTLISHHCQLFLLAHSWHPLCQFLTPSLSIGDRIYYWYSEKGLIDDVTPPYDRLNKNGLQLNYPSFRGKNKYLENIEVVKVADVEKERFRDKWARQTTSEIINTRSNRYYNIDIVWSLCCTNNMYSYI